MLENPSPKFHAYELMVPAVIEELLVNSVLSSLHSVVEVNEEDGFSFTSTLLVTLS